MSRIKHKAPTFREVSDRQLREAFRVIEHELERMKAENDLDDLGVEDLKLLTEHRTITTLAYVQSRLLPLLGFRAV